MSMNSAFITRDCWGCHKSLTPTDSIYNWMPLFRRDRTGRDILLGDMVWGDDCYPDRPKERPRYVQA